MVPAGIVFISRVTETILGDKNSNENPVQNVVVEKNKDLPELANGRVPIKIFVFFKPGVPEQQAQSFLKGDVKNILYYLNEFVDEPGSSPLRVETIMDDKTNQVMGRVYTNGISRHPAQLYEAISCILLFLFLLSIWWRYKKDLPEGRIFGYFMIILWSMRFAYEYLKENQVPFEDQLPLNMGQILSIPLVIVGILILVRSYRLPQTNS